MITIGYAAVACAATQNAQHNRHRGTSDAHSQRRLNSTVPQTQNLLSGASENNERWRRRDVFKISTPRRYHINNNLCVALLNTTPQTSRAYERAKSKNYQSFNPLFAYASNSTSPFQLFAANLCS